MIKKFQNQTSKQKQISSTCLVIKLLKQQQQQQQQYPATVVDRTD